MTITGSTAHRKVLTIHSYHTIEICCAGELVSYNFYLCVVKAFDQEHLKI